MKHFTLILFVLTLFGTPVFAGNQGNQDSKNSLGSGSCNSAFTDTAFGSWIEFTASTNDSTWMYAWDFGDGQQGFGNVAWNNYMTSGMYNVCLTVTDSINNCTSTTCDSVNVVVPVCNSTYTYSTDSTGNYVFEAQPVVSNTQYFWDFGDGGFTQGDSVVYNYQNSGQFTVCLYTSDTLTGCNSTFCDSLDIFAPVNCSATFFAIPLTGSASFVVQGMNPGMTYTFNFGDGTTGIPNNFGFVQHNYATGGIYVVCLNVVDSASGCTSSFCDSIMIQSCTISADFVTTNLTNGQVYVDALTSGFQYQYTWATVPTPDDTVITGFGRDTVTFQFTTNGIKSICLRVQDLINASCRDSLCKIVNVSGIGVEEYTRLNNTISLYPNPSSGELNLGFELEKTEPVSIMINDLTGKMILEKSGETFSAGPHRVTFNIEDLAAGTYIIQLKAGENAVYKRFTRQ